MMFGCSDVWVSVRCVDATGENGTGTKLERSKSQLYILVNL